MLIGKDDQYEKPYNVISSNQRKTIVLLQNVFFFSSNWIFLQLIHLRNNLFQTLLFLASTLSGNCGNIDGIPGHCSVVDAPDFLILLDTLYYFGKLWFNIVNAYNIIQFE